MEERATSARYVSLVTQWGKKLSEAIHKLRQQEDIISSLKREKFELAEQQVASESKIRKLEEEKATIIARHNEEKERLKNEFQTQLSKKSDEYARSHEDKSKIALLQAQLKLARNKATNLQSELSNCSRKVGQLEENYSHLETELVEAKRSKENVEGELQRMKNGMDKLEATFASLDGGQSQEKTVELIEPLHEELPPVLETEATVQEKVKDVERSTKSPSPSESPRRAPRSRSPRTRFSIMARSQSPRSPRTLIQRTSAYHHKVDDDGKNSRADQSRYNNERKLECRICKKQFQRLIMLKEHLRVVHHKKTVGTFGCIPCGVPFNSRVQYMQHRRQFHAPVVSKAEYMPDPRLTRGSYAYTRYKK
ncbi:Calcium-binding and coiled-coil domain-containing protein 1 [Orchesella cincta]|uniref:Calcium-binding and coiled-coil domain-containing protein 1 n=1 Tax=Orchesella cincta TaxID=48709 RepID=A0A1D2MYA4_ORCCI|nr:Calcium-binding and coiled-coil domain-containing protein 1 [Orchesella cincta]